jgi:glutathione S-transferase
VPGTDDVYSITRPSWTRRTPSQYSGDMAIKLYWTGLSHPSQAVRKMLELKGLQYELVDVMPASQQLHTRLAGFRGGTIPALKIDGRRIQGSREIARALEQLRPEPPLFPADPEHRARVEEAELWGEQELQSIARRIGRFGFATSAGPRRWLAEDRSWPAAGVAARLSAPAAHLMARVVEPDGRRADEAGVRADLEALPQALDRADALLADGTLAIDPPNAAALQVLASVSLLMAMDDLHDYIAARPSGAAARELFPDYPGPIPRCLPDEWLAPFAAATAA